MPFHIRALPGLRSEYLGVFHVCALPGLHSEYLSGACIVLLHCTNLILLFTVWKKKRVT